MLIINFIIISLKNNHQRIKKIKHQNSILNKVDHILQVNHMH
jgi:hypothetical protein